MSFVAYGFFVEVEPIQEDSGIVKLAEDVEDHRSVFRVISVGHKAENIKTGDIIYALKSVKFTDRGTGVTVRVCHPNDIIAVNPDGENFVATPPSIIETAGIAGNG